MSRAKPSAYEPEALLQVLGNPIYRFKQIGLEAGPLSQWLFSALAEAGLPAICVETRHMRAVLQAQINKHQGTARCRPVKESILVNLFRAVGMANEDDLDVAIAPRQKHIEQHVEALGQILHMLGHLSPTRPSDKT